MQSRNHPDRIGVAFDGHRLAANAGLMLPATLAMRTWALPVNWLNKHIWTWGDAPGRVEHRRQVDDANGIRSGRRRLHRRRRCSAFRQYRAGVGLRGEGAVHPGRLPAQLPPGACPATGPGEPGTAGPGLGLPGWDPGTAPLTIDLDSTICETYGLAKEGARRHDYTGQRGYHPLVAVAADTSDILMARLREGRANNLMVCLR